MVVIMCVSLTGGQVMVVIAADMTEGELTVANVDGKRRECSVPPRGGSCFQLSK